MEVGLWLLVLSNNVLIQWAADSITTDSSGLVMENKNLPVAYSAYYAISGNQNNRSCIFTAVFQAIGVYKVGAKSVGTAVQTCTYKIITIGY